MWLFTLYFPLQGSLSFIILSVYDLSSCFLEERAHTTVCHLPWTLAKEHNVFFYSQDFQQLLNSTTIVCLRNWAGGLGDRENYVCSCQRTLLILKAQFPSGHHLDYQFIPQISPAFFSYLLNHCFFKRKPNKSLFTLNIGLFICRVFIVAKQLIDFF